MSHLTKANPRGGGKRYAAAATNQFTIDEDDDGESDEEDGEEEEYTARAAAASAQATASAQRVWTMAQQLHGLFDEQRGGPAVQFGCFAAVYGASGSAVQDQALLRMDVGMWGGSWWWSLYAGGFEFVLYTLCTYTQQGTCVGVREPRRQYTWRCHERRLMCCRIWVGGMRHV